MIWTKKHDAFCLKNCLPPAAKLLWQWLVSEYQFGEEAEPDLTNFNQWVKRHRGKSYCRDTIKNALTQLVDCRVISIVKTFNWKIHRLVIRPLEWLFPRKNSCSRKQICDLSASNPQSTDEDVLQQQHNIEVACSEVGIVFRPEVVHQIAQEHPVEEVNSAISLFHRRGGHKTISNPSGWLLSCLENGWWLDQEVYSIQGFFQAIAGLAGREKSTESAG